MGDALVQQLNLRFEVGQVIGMGGGRNQEADQRECTNTRQETANGQHNSRTPQNLGNGATYRNEKRGVERNKRYH